MFLDNQFFTGSSGTRFLCDRHAKTKFYNVLSYIFVLYALPQNEKEKEKASYTSVAGWMLAVSPRANIV